MPGHSRHVPRRLPSTRSRVPQSRRSQHRVAPTFRAAAPRAAAPKAAAPRAAARLALLLVLLALAVGCSDSQEAEGPKGPTVRPRPSATPGEASSTTDGPTTAPPTGIDLRTPVRLVDLGLDLDQTIAAAAVPGSSSMLVAERDGRVHEVVIEGERARVVDGPLLDLTEQVGGIRSEQGLLGVAVALDGRSLVVDYTHGEDGSTKVERYELTGQPGELSVDRSSRRTLLSVEQPFANHNGGHVVFGPDGLLYVGMGDGGGADDPEGRGQDPTTLLGKILRIDPSAADLVPPDNPFVDRPDGARPEIWSTGLRNPWRFSFDAATGDLWVADVGQDEWEEVTFLPGADGAGRGANLGWDLFEGDEPFGGADPAPGRWSEGPFVMPLHTYSREGGCAVSGGVVYRGTELPTLVGAYLFGDYCGEGLRALDPSTTPPASAALEGGSLGQIVAFAEGPGGEVLVISLSEGVFLLAPA